MVGKQAGAVSFQKYVGSLFPITKNDDGLYKLSNNLYVIEKNGQKDIMYYNKT